MILVVGRRDLPDALAARPTERVADVDAALDHDATPDVVVFDGDTVQAVDTGVTRLQSAWSGVPIVLLATGDPPDALRPYDEVVYLPTSDGTLTEVVERAGTVSDYRDAVQDLYEECRRRATDGVTDPLASDAGVETSREAADELYHGVSDSSAALSALLESLDGGRDGGRDDDQ
ncbi:MAG: hypothetical protein ABEJ08_01760 [Halobacteriaceae archaeon]